MKLARWLVLACTLISISTALAKVDGLFTDLDPFLVDILPHLKKQGLNVRGHMGDKTQPPRDAEVAMLADFPVDEDRAMDSVAEVFRREFGPDRWAHSTLIDLPQAMLAIGPFPKTSKGRELHKDWLRAKGKRIFISFCGQDLPVARRLKSALEDAGYEVFVYNPLAHFSPYSNVQSFRHFENRGIRYYFESATHHLVIDSERARLSPFVNVEAMTFNGRYPRSPLPSAKWRPKQPIPDNHRSSLKDLDDPSLKQPSQLEPQDQAGSGHWTPPHDHQSPSRSRRSSHRSGVRR